MFKFYLFIIFVLLTGCYAVPGGDARVKFYNLHQDGVATISHIEKRQDKKYINFKWQPGNQLDTTTSVSDLPLSDILQFKNANNIKVGDKLNLEVIYLYLQKGTATPTLLKSSWLFTK